MLEEGRHRKVGVLVLEEAEVIPGIGVVLYVAML